MTPLCIDCAHCWRNTDGISMCGRPAKEATPAPVYCYRERSATPQADREICGPRAQFFEPKP